MNAGRNCPSAHWRHQSAIGSLWRRDSKKIIRKRRQTKEVAAQSSGCTITLKFRRAAETTKQRKHSRKGPRMSHRDAFRPCSRVSPGGKQVGKRTGKLEVYEVYAS